MVGRDRWEETHRRAGAGGSIRVIARELDLDCKTVRRCLRQTEWKPYRRAARADTLLELARGVSAAEVGYSAQVLFQEFLGSYETVKRFVRPLRETQLHAAVNPQGAGSLPSRIVPGRQAYHGVSRWPPPTVVGDTIRREIQDRLSTVRNVTDTRRRRCRLLRP